MKLILVRHGQTDLNAKRVYQGQGMDVNLDDTGIFQAVKLRQRLLYTQIDAAYASDLKRARQTADAIALLRVPALNIQVTKELRERNLGVYEGMFIDSGIYKRDLDASGLGYADFCPSGGGESWHMLQKRVVSFFTQLMTLHSNHCILAIGHGGSFTALLMYLLGTELTFQAQSVCKIDNASLTIVHWDGNHDRFQNLEIFNDTTHLD